MSRIADILKAHHLRSTLLQTQHLTVYEAENKENALRCAIKLYKRSDGELASYFQKMKSAGSDYVVKIYEIHNEPESSQMLILQELPLYGTLAKALSKCGRLEDEDAVNVGKTLLNGHIDMLRNGVFWSGTEADIEITDSGIKLSWNNSTVFSSNNQNPFPTIIERIGVRTKSKAVLPFPPNKMLDDLIKVSRENASEMSLHPLLKKRDKVFKKKGKNWLGLREIKVKNEYQLELSYFAVTQEHGFVRVKIFDKGVFDPQLLKIHQTRPNFVKILNYYEEGSSFITVSEYANDGSVQSYVKRLKLANFLLKEEQIQFIFFSLIEPLKFLNASPIVSLNMLNIRNIYIQEGIPKIGELIPMNPVLMETLKERADVPDFYHKEFKEKPESKDPRFDTYSLGVLLYKLMYTEYPIFPEGQVHIPTTPNFKKQLKDAIMLFLNKGGIIKDLEEQLQVSDTIRREVQNNERLLKKLQPVEIEQIKQDESEVYIPVSNQEDNSGRSCRERIFIAFTRRGRDSEGKYVALQTSNFGLYRSCTTIVTILLFYFLSFFLFYLIGFFNVITQTRLFTLLNINILGQIHSVIVPSYDTFQTAFASQSVTTMGCAMDDKGYLYDFIRPNSPHWLIYLALSLLTMIIFLVLKGLQLRKFSISTMLRHYYDDTVIGANTSRFALSSYVFLQLWSSFAIYCFFYLFNFLFLEQHTPCFGGSWSQLTATLFYNRIQFVEDYLLIILLVFAFGLASLLQVTYFYSKIEYGLLFNPIFIFVLPYVTLIILMRVGALSFFSPSFASNPNGVIGSSYINFVGYFPEFLVLIEIGLQFAINEVFYRKVDKKLDNFVKLHSTIQELPAEE